ncbi:cytochrome c553 [Bradyrhizobium sp. USDA 3256]
MKHPAGTFQSHIARGFVGISAICAALTPAAADQEQGRRLAQLYCARCHAIDRVSPSPLRIAPPFRTLHEHYPVEMLQESLAEGIVTGHPTMPQFSFEPDQVGDFILFLKSLERGQTDR